MSVGLDNKFVIPHDNIDILPYVNIPTHDCNAHIIIKIIENNPILLCDIEYHRYDINWSHVGDYLEKINKSCLNDTHLNMIGFMHMKGYHYTKNYEIALSYFAKALEKNPNMFCYLYNVADTHRLMKQYEIAEKLCIELVKKFDYTLDNPDLTMKYVYANMLYINVLVNLKKYTDAYMEISNIIAKKLDNDKRFSDVTEVLLEGLENIYYITNNMEEYLDILSNMITVNPKLCISDGMTYIIDNLICNKNESMQHKIYKFLLEYCTRLKKYRIRCMLLDDKQNKLTCEKYFNTYYPYFKNYIGSVTDKLIEIIYNKIISNETEVLENNYVVDMLITIQKCNVFKENVSNFERLLKCEIITEFNDLIFESEQHMKNTSAE